MDEKIIIRNTIIKIVAFSLTYSFILTILLGLLIKTTESIPLSIITVLIGCAFGIILYILLIPKFFKDYLDLLKMKEGEEDSIKERKKEA